MRRASSASHVTVREIARGGMGVVELVLRREGSFERLHALKRLLPALRSDPSVRRMFLDEARVAGLLRHPNVVSVLDVGEDERGPYLVMDYVDGISLARLIADTPAGDLIPLGVCLSLLRQIAEGLHAAHELCDHAGAPLELVHRDVSPQNVLVGYDGVARVTDFGIAKALGRSGGTTVGLLKGKAGYLSPEQLRFERLDRRSDLFSLGVVAYELLSGRRLYDGDELSDIAQRILREPPPDLAEVRGDVPDELVGLLFDLLSKDPAHRPATAAEVARALEVIERELPPGEPTIPVFTTGRYRALREVREAEQAEVVQRLARDERRRSGRMAGWAAVALAMVGMFGAAAWWLGTLGPSEPAVGSPGVSAPRPAARPSAARPVPVLEPRASEARRSERAPATEVRSEEDALAAGAAAVTDEEEEAEEREASPPRHRRRARQAPAMASPMQPEPASDPPEDGQSSHDERLWGWP